MGQWRRQHRGELLRVGGRGATERPAADHHALGAQRVLEQRRSRRGGCSRVVTVEPGPIDGQRRKRCGFVDVERGLPARRCAPGVEIGLVAEDGACDLANARRPDLPRKAGQAGLSECRVAVTLQDQRATPSRADQLALTENVGLDLVIGPERDERRVGDCELLVRGGSQREGAVASKDDGTSRQIQRHGRGMRCRHVWHGQSLCEPFGERLRARRAGRLRSRKNEGGGAGEDGGNAPAHWMHCSDQYASGQALWASCRAKIVRAAHETGAAAA